MLDESAHSGLTLAELIRRAVDRAYGLMNRRELVDTLDATCGSWSDHVDDGATYVERLRRGMARRLADG